MSSKNLYFLECFSCEGLSCQRSTLYTQTTDCDKSDKCVTLFESCKLAIQVDTINFIIIFLSSTDIPMKKSCYADLSADEKLKCDNTTNPLCYKCTGSRCNNMGRTDHKCVSCSTATNSNCLQSPGSVSATRCPAPISDDAFCFVKSVRIFKNLYKAFDSRNTVLNR